MENKKTYVIEINGVEQSIDAVKALNAQLEALESRIKSLEGKAVGIKTSGGGSKTSSTSSLSEEEKLERQIAQLDEKRVAYSQELYQNYLAAKDVLKETVNDQKQLAAVERLQADAYSNTMNGIKQKLADLKSVHFTTDISTDEFKNQTTEINALNEKLKQLEAEYGVYSRNVGNYANGVAEGLQKITIDVGGVTREFSNAKEASRTLGMELKTMAANGQQGTKEFKELQKAVAKLNSDMKDATVSSQAMDNLLDTMQSFAAIGQVTQGFSALFGFDNDEIERSIQKLVALQNAMQGIEKVQQQINSQEGIGGWLAKGNSMIDSFVEKLVGAKKAQEELNAADKAGKVASEGLAAAETAQAAATSTATVATKALSLALKTIGIGLIISAVATLITYWKDIYKWFTDTVPALKNLGTWFGKIRAMAVGVGSAIVNYMVQPLATLVKVIKAVIQGNFSDIPKIIGEGVKKTFNVVENYQKGYNKETERQQQVHNKKMLKEQEEANEEWIKNEEAKNGKSLKLTKEYVEKQMDIINKQLANEDVGSDKYKELIRKRNDLQRTLWSAEREEREKNNKKTATANKKALEEEKKQIEEARNAINSLTMRLMDEGLNKKLMQLDEEKRQTLAKLKQNSQAYLEVERLYEQLRLKEVKDYIKNLEKEIEKSANKIKNNKLSIDVSGIKEDIKKLEKDFEKEIYKGNEFRKKPIAQTLVSSTDYSDMLKFFNTTNEKIEEAKKKMKELEEERKKIFALNSDGKHLNEVIAGLDKNEKDKTTFEKEYAIELNIIRSYAVAEQKTLKESFEKRYNDEKNYFLKERKLNDDSYGENFEKLQMYLWDRTKALKEQAKKEKEIADNAASGTYETQKEELDVNVRKLKNDIRGLATNKNRTEEDEETLEKLKKSYVKYTEQYKAIYQNYQSQLEFNKKQHSARMEEIDKEEKDKMSAETEKYFQTQISNFRDFNSKMSNELSKTPTYDKAGFGIINLSATKKQYKEIRDAAVSTINSILTEKNRLDEMLKGGFISKSAYNAALSQLNDLEQSTKENLKSVQENLKNLGSDWWGSINQWVQQVGQTMNTILSSLSEIQSNQYDEMISKQEEYIDEYSDLLDKQKDKTQEYADAVKNIEDELSTARGDRRQQLIDQLNAEMAAQRASLEQEKKIEREKEKAEEKKKKLEHDQAVAKKKMQLAQAAINMAMAISMAAVNNWPIPAIPMMALAAAASAAQIAAIQSQNIPSYGSGGVIQGKSHREGGVKAVVGNSPIELEGNEFIIRKKSTLPNLNLLNFVNRSEKKLSLDDLINFYTNENGMRKKVISNSPKTKYADGGMIPTLRNDINLSDRMLTAFEDYSNRPVVVSVVDINDRQAAVNNVKVLAGLDA